MRKVSSTLHSLDGIWYARWANILTHIHFEYANFYLIDVHVTNMSLVKRSHFLGRALFNMYQKDMENKNMMLKIKLVNLLQSYFNIRTINFLLKALPLIFPFSGSHIVYVWFGLYVLMNIHILECFNFQGLDSLSIQENIRHVSTRFFLSGWVNQSSPL